MWSTHLCPDSVRRFCKMGVPLLTVRGSPASPLMPCLLLSTGQGSLSRDKRPNPLLPYNAQERQTVGELQATISAAKSSPHTLGGSRSTHTGARPVHTGDAATPLPTVTIHPDWPLYRILSLSETITLQLARHGQRVDAQGAAYRLATARHYPKQKCKLSWPLSWRLIQVVDQSPFAYFPP